MHFNLAVVTYLFLGVASVAVAVPVTTSLASAPLQSTEADDAKKPNVYHDMTDNVKNNYPNVAYATRGARSISSRKPQLSVEEVEPEGERGSKGKERQRPKEKKHKDKSSEKKKPPPPVPEVPKEKKHKDGSSEKKKSKSKKKDNWALKFVKYAATT